MQIQLINKSNNPLPSYQTLGAAGMDLYANLSSAVELKPMQRSLIPTGLFIALPIGFEAQIRPRSGLAFKQGITCLNSPGTIDSDYRGELNVLLINLSNETQTIQHGDRIAQLVIAKHESITWHEVLVLEESERGVGGFGSTGKK